jgi:hypothetical protein
MKANELMIGDWVIHPYYKHPSKIVYFNGSRVRVEYEEVEAESLRPIPLTPEILEKIGFESQPNIGYIIDDWDGTQIIYDSWNHNLRIIKNYKVCLDIEAFDDIAVHELQHALKLCGIEKEIEL